MLRRARFLTDHDSVASEENSSLLAGAFQDIAYLLP